MGLLSDGYSVYGEDTVAAAKAAGVDPNLFAALIQVESGYNPVAINTRNKNGTTDYGIAQLNSATFPNAQNMTVKQQLQAAANYLASRIKANKGDVAKGVAAYNGTGPAAEAYAKKVIVLSEQLGKIGPNSYNPDGTIKTDVLKNEVASVVNGINNTVVTPVTDKIVGFLKDNAAPITLSVIAGCLIIFGIGGALMGANPVNILKGKA